MNDHGLTQNFEMNLIPIDKDLPALPLTPVVEEEAQKSLSRRQQRSLAFHFLYVAEQTDYSDSLASIVAMFREGFELDIPSDAHAIVLAEGVIGMRDELDKNIIPFLKNWKLDRLGCCTRLILRLALWELMQPDAIVSIVINEAIELAKGFAEKDAFRFINGILDEFVKAQAAKPSDS